MEELVPILRVKDAEKARGWYERLGFVATGVHRFEPSLPAYMFLERGDVHLHLSEHKGDAPKKGLAYFYVHDVEAVGREFAVSVRQQPWGPEVGLVDPDGNRIRVGQAQRPPADL